VLGMGLQDGERSVEMVPASGFTGDCTL
jgi:hypothetical protein